MGKYWGLLMFGFFFLRVGDLWDLSTLCQPSGEANNHDSRNRKMSMSAQFKASLNSSYDYALSISMVAFSH